VLEDFAGGRIRSDAQLRKVKAQTIDLLKYFILASGIP
jgi:hypothetical protein